VQPLRVPGDLLVGEHWQWCRGSTARRLRGGASPLEYLGLPGLKLVPLARRRRVALIDATVAHRA
jgi:hypothetical protein